MQRLAAVATVVARRPPVLPELLQRVPVADVAIPPPVCPSFPIKFCQLMAKVR